MSISRSYTELSRLYSFMGRFNYLKLRGVVGEPTFDFNRWVGQQFYRSHEWKTVREYVIIRDDGCDLGIRGYEIHQGLLVHHMNPVTVEDITQGLDWIFDPEYLITTSLTTHNAIHYGDESLLPRGPVVRRAGDTTLW